MIPGPVEIAILIGAVAILFFSGQLPAAWALVQKQLGGVAAKKAEGALRDAVDQVLDATGAEAEESEPTPRDTQP